MPDGACHRQISRFAPPLRLQQDAHATTVRHHPQGEDLS
jgi:hypothetical protein